MTQIIKYVGKKSPYTGKTLWEIIGNLKDFGVGRIILRNSQVNRHKEPCFLKILEVKAMPNILPPKIKVFRWPTDFRDKDHPRRVQVICECVFRGAKMDENLLIRSTSHVPDFSLVPKHLEKNYVATKTSKDVIEQNILPRELEFPPLVKNMLIKKGVANPKMPASYSTYKRSWYRIAEEGEKPTREVHSGLGTPRSPNLFKTVNYDI